MRPFLVCSAFFATLLFSVVTFAQGPDLSRHPQFGPPKDNLAEPPAFDPHQSQGPKVPNFSQPAENKTWTCSNCGAVIGMGPNEPTIEVCPKCGAKLTSWFNYWIIGGLGGAAMAMLVLGGIVMQLVKSKKAA